MLSRYSFLTSLSLLVLLTSCGSQQNRDIVSQRFVHKYGYDVPKEEWNNQQYPGQVITQMRDGVTIVETYEDGLLNGVRSETFSHSQTVRFLEQYDRGSLRKRTTYSVRGIPEQEEIFFSPQHVKVTYWLPNGSPLCKEEWSFGKIISGQYFNALNEVEAQLERGSGERLVRDASGLLQAREFYQNSELVHLQTYYPNQTPHISVSFKNGKRDGVYKEFAASGEPLCIESWRQNMLHGEAVYYQNGLRYLEIAYQNGLKHGLERHFIDEKHVCSETTWFEGNRHGPSVVLADGTATTRWYYFGQKVANKAAFDEKVNRLATITMMHEKSARKNTGASNGSELAGN